MKKNVTAERKGKGRAKGRRGALTIGLDRVDKTSRYCALDEVGESRLQRSGPLTVGDSAMALRYFEQVHTILAARPP